MPAKPQKSKSDPCRCCGRYMLLVIRSTLVCTHCDNVIHWPKGV